MDNQHSSDTFKYFAYGSNLLRERILINNPTARVYGIGKLNGYTLSFDSPEGVDASIWLGAGATIVPVDYSSSVFGVIWDIHVSDLDNLNRQEWCYEALQVDVEVTSHTLTTVSSQPSLLRCRTYRITTGNGDTLPSPHYKKVIIMGAHQNGLPTEYISFLEQLPVNQVTEVPWGYKKVMEMLKDVGGIAAPEDNAE